MLRQPICQDNGWRDQLPKKILGFSAVYRPCSSASLCFSCFCSPVSSSTSPVALLAKNLMPCGPTSRSFSYTLNPFTGSQWTGVSHENTSRFTVDPSILPFIAGGPIAPTTARWDLIDIQRASQYGIGDAKILLEYLSLDTDRNHYWTEWTQANPLAAPVLWSAVRDCVPLATLRSLARTVRNGSHPNRCDASEIGTGQNQCSGLPAKKLDHAAGDTAAARRAAQLGLSYGQSDELKLLANP